MFKITGTVKSVGPTEQVTEKFTKRMFVIEEKSSMYPQTIEFQTKQDKTSILDGISEGEEVEISFNIQGREWTNPQGEVKIFNTLDAWRVETVGGSSTATATSSAPVAEEEGDELPF